MLEAVARESERHLKLNSPARFKGGHEEFARRLAALMTETLDKSGYAWARVPKHGDDLYKILVEAIDMSGGDMRFGLTSDDPELRKTSRMWIADRMLDLFQKTETAVVRRRARR